MIEFDGTCGSCPLNWVDYKYSESTVCAVTRKDVEDADKCDCPTERRAALIAQLGVEDREALELGCRVRALTTTIFSRSRSCEHTETAETREEAAANCLIAVLEGRQHE